MERQPLGIASQANVDTPPGLRLSRREARLILRLRQLERQQVARVLLDVRAWRILEKIDDRQEHLDDVPPIDNIAPDALT